MKNVHISQDQIPDLKYARSIIETSFGEYWPKAAISAYKTLTYIIDKANDKPVFCLALNKPINQIDFSSLSRCTPEKCTCCKAAIVDEY